MLVRVEVTSLASNDKDRRIMDGAVGKLIIIFFLLLLWLIVMSHSAISVLTDDIVTYHKFDNTTTSGSTSIDSLLAFNGTISGATTGIEGKIFDAYDYDGTSDGVTLPTSGYPLSTTWTYATWFKADALAGKIQLMSLRDNTEQIQLHWQSDEIRLYGYSTACYDTAISFPDTSTASWYYLVVGYDGSNLWMNLNNGSVTDTSVCANGQIDADADIFIGADNGLAQSWNGKIDEVGIWNRTLSVAEINTLYNNTGGLQYPFDIAPPPPIDTNYTIESITEFDQLSDVEITTTTYQTIFSGTTDVHNETTDVYATLSISASRNSPAPNPSITCRILINGMDNNSQQERSFNNNGDFASLYLLTQNFSVSGNVTLDFQCKGATNKNILLQNGNGLLHILHDRAGIEIPNVHHEINVAINSSSYELLHELSYQVNTTNATIGKVISLIFDGSHNFNYTNTSRLSMILEVDGVNTTEVERDGSAGTVGIVGDFYISKNVSNGSIVPIKFYGKSTTSDGIINCTYNIKEYITGMSELIYNQSFSSNITTNNYSLLQSSILENIGISEGVSIITKVAVGSYTDDISGAIIDFMIQINSTNGTQSFRTVNNNNTIGISILQDSSPGFSEGNYTINIFARSNNSNAAINSIHTISYLADTHNFTPSSFNVSIFNEWNNVSINNFTATTDDGRIFNTNTGIISIPTTDATENVTISSPGYFNKTVLEHNTSINLNTSLFQTEIGFITTELLTENLLTEVNYTISGVEKDENQTYHLAVGSYNVTASKPGYFDLIEEISVTEFQNETLNLTGMFNAIANFTAINYIDMAFISNFSLITNFSFNTSTTLGFIEVPILQNLTFTLDASSPEKASIINESFEVNTNIQLFNLTFFTFNSVLINIFNESDLKTLNYTNVTIITISDDDDLINTTDTGQILIDFLVPNNYEVRFAALGFNPISKFITVTNDSTQNLSVYMTDNASTEIQVIEVIDTTSSPVEGAVVWLQKEEINFTSRWVTVQEAETNNEGRTSVFVQRSTVDFYRFAVIFNGTAVPIEPNGELFTTKTVFLPGVTETIQLIVNFESDPQDFISDRLAISYNLEFGGVDNLTAIYTFLDGRNTIIGGKLVLEGKYLNSSLQYEVIEEQTLFSSSGQINITVPEINNTQFRVQAFIIKTGGDELVDELFKSFTIDVMVDKNTGLLYSIIILIVIVLLTRKFGTLISSVFTFVVLGALVAFNIVNIPVGVITSFIALSIILFMRTRKQ